MQASFLTLESTTFAGRLDPRVKLGLCVAGSLVTLLLYATPALLVLLVCSTGLALTATRPLVIARVCVATSAMMAISLACSRLILLAVPGLFEWNLLTLMTPFLRMLIVVTLLLHLAMSTPAQVIMRLLQGLHLPGFVRLPLSVAIRFIPTFMDDCKQIGEAARLRPGKGWLSAWRCLAVPLVFRTLASADDLAIAAELKGLSATGTCTAPKFSSPSRRDYRVLMGAAVTVLMAVGLQFWHVSSGGVL